MQSSSTSMGCPCPSKPHLQHVVELASAICARLAPQVSVLVKVSVSTWSERVVELWCARTCGRMLTGHMSGAPPQLKIGEELSMRSAFSTAVWRARPRPGRRHAGGVSTAVPAGPEPRALPKAVVASIRVRPQHGHVCRTVLSCPNGRMHMPPVRATLPP